MRITLTLDGEAFSVAQNYAQARALKLGQAVSERIRLGSTERLPMRQKNGAWVFVATAARHGARLVTFDPGIASLLATDTERERLLAVLH